MRFPPEILYSLYTARAEGADFSSKLLRLAKIIHGPRDGPRALKMALQLIDSERSLTSVGAYAMALAETDRFEQAVSLQEQCLEMVRQAGQHDLEANLEAGLTRYRQRLPSRSPLGE